MNRCRITKRRAAYSILSSVWIVVILWLVDQAKRSKQSTTQQTNLLKYNDTTPHESAKIWEEESVHKILKDVAISSRNKGRIVPNIVHFIWFYPEKTLFRFHHLTSFISVHKFLKPSFVILWCNSQPSGKWWSTALEQIPEILLIRRAPPAEIHGRSVNVPEHQSDVARLKILREYGGVYVDLDVVVLRPFDSLRRYEVTMGAETPNLLGSGIILAAPDAEFLKLWWDSYKSFDDKQWNDHSVVMPMKLYRNNTKLVHVEWYRLERPNWDERDWLYKENMLWDWKDNYAVHLWYRTHNVEYNPHTIQNLNTTMGEIFRYVHFNKSVEE